MSLFPLSAPQPIKFLSFGDSSSVLAERKVVFQVGKGSFKCKIKTF